MVKEFLKNIPSTVQAEDMPEKLRPDVFPYFYLMKDKKLLENLNSLKINLENKEDEVNEIKSKYESLKLAKSITLDGEKKLAKKKIKKMIDDIDDCIINIMG